MLGVFMKVARRKVTRSSADNGDSDLSNKYWPGGPTLMLNEVHGTAAFSSAFLRPALNSTNLIITVVASSH